MMPKSAVPEQEPVIKWFAGMPLVIAVAGAEDVVPDSDWPKSD